MPKNFPGTGVMSYVTGPPQSNAISMSLVDAGCSHMMIQCKESNCYEFSSVVVSRFYVKPISKRWFFKNCPSDHET